MTVASRWTIVEYGEPQPFIKEMSESSSLSVADVKLLVDSAGHRVAANLNLSTSPITVERDQIRAVDIAGLLRIAPGIELEIAPKFLGNDTNDTRWREDFFFLAVLSKHGKVLTSERLHTGRSASRELPMLVARTMIEMQRTNSRRPLRTYRQSNELNFDLDGVVDPETVVLPSPHGFSQEYVRYDRRNIYNATIKAALLSLQRDVRDPEVRMQLGRAMTELGAQSPINFPRHRRLPSRSRRWQDMYDLSVDVLMGMGLTFQPHGSPRSPGYVVSTWQVWEDLLTLAARLGFSESDVHAQKPLSLGLRTRVEAGMDTEKRRLPVEPDIRIESIVGSERGPLVLDAKYKTRASKKEQRIDEADVYESLAFARAAKTDTVILLYPAVPDGPTDELGSVTTFERVEVGNVTIHGLQVEVRGIAGSDGLRKFSTALRSGIDNTVEMQSN